MSDRYFEDCPVDVERAAIASAKALLGAGYVVDYYASATSEFMWLYLSGYRAAMNDIRKRNKLFAKKFK